MQELLGLKPDPKTYGKTIANNLPHRVLERLENFHCCPPDLRVSFSGTVLSVLDEPTGASAARGSQLNGTHGEFTCSDDVKTYQSGPYKGMTPAQKRKVKQSENKTNEKKTQINITLPKRVPPKQDKRSEVGLSETASNIKELVSAILLQDKPYVLPRPAGAFVAPHQYRWKKQISLSDPTKFRTGFLFTNNLDGILHIGQKSVNDHAVTNGTYGGNEPGIATLYPGGVLITVDATMQFTDRSAFKASTLPMTTGVHWSNNKRQFVPGHKYYPGIWATNPTNLTATLYSVGGVGANMTIRLTRYNKAYQGTNVLSTNVVMANNNNSYNFTAALQWVAFCNSMALEDTLGFSVAFTVDQNVSQGYGNHISLKVEGLEIASPLSWTSYSLWDLISEGAIAKAQYEKASRHNVTGNAITLTNTTAELVKGGSIYAARLPGNSYSEIGGTLDDLVRVISCQVDHVMASSELRTGMHYSFTPEKLQDWLFERPMERDPYGGDPANIPYCAAVIDASGIDPNSTPTFMLTGIVSVEYLTVDPSNWKVSSPSNSLVFDAILNALAAENCVSENPDHVANIRRVVSNVMTSQNMKMAIRALVTAGVKVAPFVLSML